MSKRDANDSGTHSEGSDAKRLRELNLKIEAHDFPLYFKTESTQDVLRALLEIRIDVNLLRPIRWNMLLHLLDAMKTSYEPAPECVKFAWELLCLLQRYQCKHAKVIWWVLQVLMLAAGPFRQIIEIDEKFEQFFCLPYGKKESYSEMVWDAARCANLGILKLQLKFGMGLMTPTSSGCWMTFYEHLEDWLEGPVEMVFLQSSDESTDDDTPSADVEERAITERKVIRKHLRRNFKPASWKRISLIMRMLEMIGVMKSCGPYFKEHFCECYRLLFDSVAEPYLTSIEVKASLDKYLPASCSQLISRITADFTCTLPELADVPQPRSLSHLCRTQVRQCLRQNLNLPHGVSSLPVPTFLKQYIMLNDDGDYSVIFKCDEVFDSI